MNIVVTAAPPACGARPKVSTVLSSGHNEKTGKAGHDLNGDTVKKLLLAVLATGIAAGLPMEMSPRFSPDGDRRKMSRLPAGPQPSCQPLTSMSVPVTKPARGLAR